MKWLKTVVAALGAAVLVLALAPGAAVAAKPKPNGVYDDCKTRNGETRCAMRFGTSGNRRKIEGFTLYTKCSPVPIEAFFEERFRVSKKGRFKIDGTYVNVLEEEIEFFVKGTFKKRGKKAVGRYEVDDPGDCNDRKRKFTAKYRGPQAE